MFKKIIFLLILFIFCLPFVFLFWWQKQTLPLNPDQKETKLFIVPKGWGVEKIGERLKEEQLIRSAAVFKLMVYKEGMTQKLQAGDFKISPAMNLFEIVQSLTHGSVDIWVTIPEGLRNEEIALIISQTLNKNNISFDEKDFLAQVSKEGVFIFPDTYLIPKDSSVAKIVKILADNFEKKYSSLKINNALTKKQIITLASLVEREAKYDQDRPVIAGILLKRLKKGWPLQVDATVQYAKASIDNQLSKINDSIKWWNPVNQQDLKTINSDYNTYKNIGLPPGPICAPGLASLQAAANPSDSKYWFYISDKSGHIHFAENLRQQEKNIARYLTAK